MFHASFPMKYELDFMSVRAFDQNVKNYPKYYISFKGPIEGIIPVHWTYFDSVLSNRDNISIVVQAPSAYKSRSLWNVIWMGRNRSENIWQFTLNIILNNFVYTLIIPNFAQIIFLEQSLCVQNFYVILISSRYRATSLSQFSFMSALCNCLT